MSRRSFLPARARLLLLGVALFLHCVPGVAYSFPGDPAAVHVIPVPVRLEYGKGTFELSPQTTVVYRGATKEIPVFAAELVSRLGATEMKRTLPTDTKDYVVMEFSNDPQLGQEGYRLAVTTDGVRITAKEDAGLAYGVATLLQLLPPEAFRSDAQGAQQFSLPCVSILDYPRFRWRGMHLDVSRHFMPKEFIKKYIDIIAFHKMNTFHWHLTDDQGWRIEIRKYPRLTSRGAWRVNREDQHWNSREKQRPGEESTYGGFYTQDEIREIVRYAAERHVTIVPEIEMPAHATAALAAYPQFSCTGGPFTVPPGGVWPITDIFCAGNDSTFIFLENVLTEVMDLFPGSYIHVGGDEADKMEWKCCPKCQSRMKANRLKDENRLQSYFMKRIEKFLRTHGRKLIGWDEILDGGLPPRATVMSWRGTGGGIAAARTGHDVVMTPGEFCYFDFYQGRREFEPLAIGGFTPLSEVYRFEPVPAKLSAAQARHIIGAQGNVWTEYISGPEHVEYMIMPRMAAMAEVLWSPRRSRDWDDFARRVEDQMQRYEALGYTYAKSAYLVGIAPVADRTTGQLRVSLGTDLPVPEIRYTLDGSDPSVLSPRYEAPVAISSSVTLRAASFRNGMPLGKVSFQEFVIHKAVQKPVRVLFPYEKYTGGGDRALTNGLRGTLSFDDGNWQGYHEQDFVAMLDLGTIMPVTKISTSYLQNTLSWIFLPTSVEYSVSEDGVVYSTVASVEIPVAAGPGQVEIRNITERISGIDARFIRVVARNTGIAPQWHYGSGQQVWLFVDEIIVE